MYDVSPESKTKEGMSNWNTAPKCFIQVRRVMIAACHYFRCNLGMLTHLSAIAWIGESHPTVRSTYRYSVMASVSN